MKSVLVVIISSLLSINMYGQHRSEEQALEIAASFMETSISESRLYVLPEDTCHMAKVRSVDPSCKAPSFQSYYIVNDSVNGRYAIVSADERMGDILGYSDRGIYATLHMPPALLDLLSCYDLIAENLDSLGDPPIVTRAANVINAVEPLVKTHWGQGYPYNLNCPEIDGQKCPTGCGATALAQVLNYYKYSPNGVGCHSYITLTNGIQQSIDFESLNLQWDKLICDYNDTTSEEECKEVAKLMHACGVSLSMDYKLGASGIKQNSIAYPLKHFWGYNPNTAYWDALYDYGSVDFRDMLYSQLLKGHPVLVDLYSRLGYAHEAIIDGIDETGKMHFNFGWEGTGDGYYSPLMIQVLGYSFLWGSYTYNITPELYGDNSDDFLLYEMNVPKEIFVGDDINVEYTLNCYCTNVPKSHMYIDEMLDTTIGIGIFDSKFNFISSIKEWDVSVYSDHGLQVSWSFSTNNLLDVNNDVLYLAPYEKLASDTYKHITAKSGMAEMYELHLDDQKILLMPKRYSDLKDIEDCVKNFSSDPDFFDIHIDKTNVELSSSIDTSVGIYNISGLCVSRFRLKANEKYIISLPKGIYIINNKKFCIK